MIKITLSQLLFSLLEKQVPDSIGRITNITKSKEYVTLELNLDDLRELQMDINDEIVLNGLDNQETVNDLGIKLYELYDEILYQKNNQ